MNDDEKRAEEWVSKRVELSGEDEAPNISPLIDKELKQAFLAGLRAGRPKWVSVKERLPEHARTVMLWDGAECWWGHYQEPMSEFVYYFGNEVKRLKTFTHWMPLPLAPEKEE